MRQQIFDLGNRKKKIRRSGEVVEKIVPEIEVEGLINTKTHTPHLLEAMAYHLKRSPGLVMSMP